MRVLVRVVGPCRRVGWGERVFFCDRTYAVDSATPYLLS
jgi:hypothetical protein